MTHILSPRRVLRSLLLATSWSMAAIAMAHPGHGTIESTEVAHYMIDPLHALPWIVALVGVATYFAMQFLRSGARRCQDQ